MYILLLSATGSLAASIPRAVGAIQNTTQEFKLQAVPKAGLSGYKQHEGLWLQSYHTGAGENDVVLRPNETQSNVAFLNYTEGTTGRVIFNPGADYPSGFVAAQTPNYAAWTPMNINSISPGDQGFFFNESGLQWNGGYFANTTKPYNSWAGWLGMSNVCPGIEINADLNRSM